MVKEYIRAVQIASMSSMKRKSYGNKTHLPNVWWNNEIKDLRCEVNKYRRRFQRARKKGKTNAEELEEKYKHAKKMLKCKISNSKTKAWIELCETLNKDPWGKLYKYVMDRVRNKAPIPTLGESAAKKIINELFPINVENKEDVIHDTDLLVPSTSVGSPSKESTSSRSPAASLNVSSYLKKMKKLNKKETVYTYRLEKYGASSEGNLKTRCNKDSIDSEEDNNSDPIPSITNEELINAAKKLKDKKAPGLDGLPMSIIKWLIKSDTTIIAKILTRCIRRSEIPKEWKAQRVLLIPKEGREPGTAGAYRPLCIMDGWAKCLEYILKERILNSLGQPHFEDKQYGFIKNRSTLDALMKVKQYIETAKIEQTYALLLAIDVKNAFNSIIWENIHKELINREVPEYLRKIIKNYFDNRWIYYLISNKWFKRKMH